MKKKKISIFKKLPLPLKKKIKKIFGVDKSVYSRNNIRKKHNIRWNEIHQLIFGLSNMLDKYYKNELVFYKIRAFLHIAKAIYNSRNKNNKLDKVILLQLRRKLSMSGLDPEEFEYSPRILNLSC